MIGVLAVLGGVAAAEGGGEATATASPEWRGERSADESAVLAIAPADHQLAASLGIALGLTGQTPGGLRVQGEYDRLLTGPWWLALHAAAVFGADERACYFDRADDFQCDHGATDGLGLALGGGIMRSFGAGGRTGAFVPYARAGGELSLVDFGADSVSGVGVALRGGAGVRWEMTERLGLFGEGVLGLGLASLGGERKDPESGGLAWFEARFGVAFVL